MARPKGKARAAAAAAAASRSRSPDKQEVPPDIMRDINHSERFAELGSFALSLALTSHLAAAYPNAPASLLSDLRDLNLSRHNLTQVAYRLESKGLIVVKKATEKVSGSTQGMDAYGIGVAGDFTLATPEEPNNHMMWEGVRLPLQVGGGVMSFCLGLRFQILEAMMILEENNIVPINIVAMKDLGIGFQAGMANYTIQSAGLNYVESGYDVVKFWEKYKEHLEPIIGPENLENSREAAGLFEAEMRGVIEVVPRYKAYSLKK